MSDDNANERTCYVSNLHSKVTQSILEEMFIQMGPVERVVIPDTKGNQHKYSFVIFKDPESVIFASQCLDKISLYGMEISVRPKSHTAQEEEYKKLLAKVAREKHSYLDFPTPIPFNNSLIHGQHYQPLYARSQSDRRDKRGSRNTQNIDDTPSTSRMFSRHNEDTYNHMHHSSSPYNKTPTSYRKSRHSHAEESLSGTPENFRRHIHDYSTTPYLNAGTPLTTLNLTDVGLIMLDRQVPNFCNNLDWPGVPRRRNHPRL